MTPHTERYAEEAAGIIEEMNDLSGGLDEVEIIASALLAADRAGAERGASDQKRACGCEKCLLN